ncbi:MAG: GHKL domain-containing protein [Lachnospiraceae bacterium]|nr:GHKL domain-containing protein [Lachnospiraceae bacterium]
MAWLYDNLLIFVNICISSFEAFMLWEAGQSFFHPRFQKGWKTFCVLGIMVAANFAASTLLPADLLLFCCFLIDFAAVYILFDNNILWKGVYVTFFIVVQCASELLLYVFTFGSDLAQLVENRNSLQSYIMAAMICKLIAFCILLLAVKGLSKGRIGRLPGRVFISYLIMPISSLLILFLVMSYCSEVAGQSVSIVLVICSIGVLIANAILLYIFEGYAESMELKEAIALSEQKASLEAKHYQQLEEINRKNLQHVHDIKHILQSADNLIEIGESGKAREVLHSMNELIIHTNNTRYCQNSIINAVLNSKKELAESLALDYQAEVDAVLQNGSIKPEELIVVLGNLLDNAIEAAAKVPEGGYIRTKIQMKNRGTFLSICVENNYEEELKIRGGQLISSKKDAGMHGLGLQSINKTVKKRNGVESISYDNKIFIHQVVLSIR